MDSDTTIPYPIQEDGVPPTETPPAGALAPKTGHPLLNAARGEEKGRRGAAGHRRPKEEGLRLLPLRHHLLLVGAATIGKLSSVCKMFVVFSCYRYIYIYCRNVNI